MTAMAASTSVERCGVLGGRANAAARVTTPRMPAQEMTAAAFGWNLPSPAMNLCCTHLNGKTQIGRMMITVASTARQVATIVPQPGPVSFASWTSRRICMPSMRKTTFSRMNWIVRPVDPLADPRRRVLHDG